MLSAIVFLPLAGAIIAGFFGRQLGERGAEYLTTSFMMLALGLSLAAFSRFALGHGEPVTLTIFTWIDSGALEVAWKLRFDALTGVMLVVVNTVSALVHLYSIGYMAEDPHRPRFFAYLSLFTFAMLMLVTADNFLQMFFGWEGVGLASYLLIGFWYHKPEANAAAIKAFIVNRVGDFGFVLGIMGVFFAFGSLDFSTVFAAVPEQAGQTFEFLGMRLDVLDTICLLLFMGAMGKSAQVPLHTWLPDAMEGPTPVSALIHAATMVTAGVFLVCRCSPMFEFAPVALAVVTIVGATTAFFAATVGMFQNDIKRVIAYSTCSQLGYMFFACGVSAYEAAMFHLFTYAFFKALLFLGAGSVIHAMHHEQDMRHMGGLFRLIPMTWMMMLVGTFALTGVGIPLGVLSHELPNIGFAGFYSKDAIIESVYAAATDPGIYAFIAGIAAALMTSFYSWRLIFMTFHGPHHEDEETLTHVHESPPVMMIPLAVLAFGAAFAGMYFADDFIGHHRGEFWKGAIFVLEEHKALDLSHEVPTWVKLAPLAVMLTGLAIAWHFYLNNPGLPARMAERKGLLYTFIYRKWYFDELYDLIFVRPAYALARLFWRDGDGWLIDGFGPDGVAARVMDTTRRVVQLQSGYIYHYAFAMLIGIAALVTYFMAMGAQ
ncbi:MAG: NADH-quinone oxidoreductase subunit L [Alphaproteobacteria bacterium]|nr:NADH-quinone oxidoreductase subunit L [Alphaproteobacteria bacterium]